MLTFGGLVLSSSAGFLELLISGKLHVTRTELNIISSLENIEIKYYFSECVTMHSSHTHIQSRSKQSCQFPVILVVVQPSNFSLRIN